MIQEPRHGVHRVEHAFVHVHVDDLRAVLDLIACNRHCAVVVVAQNQLGEARRPGHIGALAYIYQQRVLVDTHGLEPRQLGS